MIRKASIMKVYEDCYDEYKKRHDDIWPEMEKMLTKYGACNYSIFLDKRNGNLFSYMEIEDEELWEKSAKTEICKKWWDYMKDLMETNEDNSPVSIALDEIFHLKS
ncbi:L-rhamnose mutarotase [Clostridium acidisoli DSM 12555]|uniref:L-rhamnose mutarotase n=1 Tax=Clostridium acidisoli DSM 12555 TaxID=1121291 RepID=A0A1W1XSK2_9CLOT|nr:L-rhamnose mutarotase [Clostridium acidisoli]SMC26940.1 L-rhamnose mutarotase [Clostridium acidisoli DSM 12555]